VIRRWGRWSIPTRARRAASSDRPFNHGSSGVKSFGSVGDARPRHRAIGEGQAVRGAGTLTACDGGLEFEVYRGDPANAGAPTGDVLVVDEHVCRVAVLRARPSALKPGVFGRQPSRACVRRRCSGGADTNAAANGVRAARLSRTG